MFCSGFKAEGEVFDHQRPVSEFKAKALWIVEPVFALSVPVISMCETDRTWLSIASNREYLAKHNIAQSSVFCVHIKPVCWYLDQRQRPHTAQGARRCGSRDYWSRTSSVCFASVQIWQRLCNWYISNTTKCSAIMEIEGLFSFNVKMDHYVQ